MRKYALLVASVVLCMTGCTNTYRQYEGAPKPSSEVAVIQYENMKNTEIEKINDEDVGPESGMGLTMRWELMPGEQKIQAYYDDGKSIGESITTYFMAEAGKEYTLVGVLKRDEKTTQQTVDASQGEFASLTTGSWILKVIDQNSKEVVNYRHSRK